VYGLATLAVWGQKLQLDCVVCFAALGNKFRLSGWLHAHRVQPLSASRCVALLHSALDLIEGQGQRAFASAAAHVRLRRQVSSS